MNIDQQYQLIVPTGGNVLQHLPSTADLAILGVTTDEDITLRVGLDGSPIGILAGAHITLHGFKPREEPLIIEARERKAQVTMALSFDDEPSAVDQLGDLVRRGRR